MDKIVQGVHAFHQDEANAMLPMFEKITAAGQKPQALIITCSDSRLSLDRLTQAYPGDIFVVRNIGNLIPRPEDAWEGGDNSVGAALDYALDVLKVPNIILLGHSDCGAMKALLSEQAPPSRRTHIGDWLRNARLSLSRFHGGHLDEEDHNEADRLSQVNVLAGLDHLADYLCVRRRIDNMSLTIHGWWFDVHKARMLAYEPRAGKFVDLQNAYPSTLSKAVVLDPNPHMG